MKFRSLLSIVVIIAVVSLIVIGVAFPNLFYPKLIKAGGVTTTPTATRFVPRQAPLMVSLLTNPDDLDTFAQLGGKNSYQKDLTQLKKTILAKTGLDYRREIQPWLGDEMTLAITDLDPDHNSANGIQPGYLLVVTSNKPTLAKQFLQTSFSKNALAETNTLEFDNYKGVNLVSETTVQGTAPLQLKTRAVVGNYVIFASEPQVLRDAINNAQAVDLNLETAPAYQSALATITEPRIGLAVMNLPAISAWITHQPLPTTPPAEQMLTVALSLKPQGLVAETALIGVSGDAQREPVLDAPVTALALIPANTVLTTAGVDLNHLWEEIETGLEPDTPLHQLFHQGMTQLEAPFGVDLPTEIFAWVRGEYALATVPHGEGLDWLFVAETPAEAEWNEILAHLDQLAQGAGYSVGTLPLFEQTMTAWTKLETQGKGNRLVELSAQVKGVHTHIDRYEVFSSSIELLSQAVAQQEASLINSDKFQDAIASLPSHNDGYFYIDWQESSQVFRQLPLLKIIRFTGNSIFQNLESLTITSEGSENGVRRATVFFNFQ